MKNLLNSLVLGIGLMLITHHLSANHSPAGYWVVEKNNNFYQARYYNAQSELIYESSFKTANFTLNAQTLADLSKKLNRYLQKNLSQKGCWVTESNVNTRDYTIVRFYNAQNQQIFEEKLAGKFLTLNSRNIRKLNHSLKVFLANQPIKLNL
jgi:hypothetical protein